MHKEKQTEMNMDTIWLVVEDDDCFIETRAFKEKSEAEKLFKEKRGRAIEFASEEDIQVDDETCVEIYEDGCYAEGHYYLSLRELPVN